MSDCENCRNHDECRLECKDATDKCSFCYPIEEYWSRQSADYKHGYADAIADLQKRFRNEYEEMMELEMEDCINWADWLDATAEQIMTDRKG